MQVWWDACVSMCVIPVYLAYMCAAIMHVPCSALFMRGVCSFGHTGGQDVLGRLDCRKEDVFWHRCGLCAQSEAGCGRLHGAAAMGWTARPFFLCSFKKSFQNGCLCHRHHFSLARKIYIYSCICARSPTYTGNLKRSGKMGLTEKFILYKKFEIIQSFLVWRRGMCGEAKTESFSIFLRKWYILITIQVWITTVFLFVSGTIL